MLLPSTDYDDVTQTSLPRRWFGFGAQIAYTDSDRLKQLYVSRPQRFVSVSFRRADGLTFQFTFGLFTLFCFHVRNDEVRRTTEQPNLSVLRYSHSVSACLVTLHVARRILTASTRMTGEHHRNVLM